MQTSDTLSEILATKQLRKDYASFTFGPMDLSIRSGETLAIFGHNGAGKSTFFQMITGQLDASSGEVRVLDQKMVPESFELKRHIGYLPQNLDLPSWVTGEEILSYASRLYQLPLEKLQPHMEVWACSEYRKRPIATCSHGMKKRVGLALATMHNPDLLILDEPFSGLDVGHIRTLENFILQRDKEGKSTILCTHIIPYSAKICSSAVLFDNGQLHKMNEWKEWSFSQRIENAEKLIFKEKE